MSSRSIEIARQALIDQYNAQVGRTDGVTPAERSAVQDLVDGDYIAKDTLHANSILKADTDHTPIELTVAASTIVGRGAAGGVEDLSPAEVRVVLGFSAGANDAWDEPGAGAFGVDSAAHMAALVKLVKDIQTALKANGILA